MDPPKIHTVALIHLIPTEEVDKEDETFILLLCLFSTRCNVLPELGKCYNLLPRALELHHPGINRVNCSRNDVKNPTTNVLLDYTISAILGEVNSMFNREEREKIDGK